MIRGVILTAAIPASLALTGCADWPGSLDLPDYLTPSAEVTGTTLGSADVILAGVDALSGDRDATVAATEAEGADLREKADALRARQP
ncbi:MAG: hypothetical protein JJ872_01830 [Marivivens sp.]|nr:hypothetical protein [Marivivens sp.]